MNREETIRLLRERIVAFAKSRLWKAGDFAAEDLAQETLMVMEERYSQVTAIEEMVPLAMRIVRFKLMSQVAKSNRRGEGTAVPVEEMPLADPGDDPEVLTLRREKAKQFAVAFAQLGERCQQIFRWKVGGANFAEIQQRLGAESINTVYTWDARCRKQLLGLLQRGEEGGGYEQ